MADSRALPSAMAAVSLSTACFLLWAAIIATTTTAAPTPVAEGDLSQSQALDFHNETDASRCYYNFQHYEEGDRIVTNEPCLNCTCHKRMLMCYLRVCPFTKAVGQDCTVEKRPDQCCPVITCPQVPVDILTSSTTTEASKSTEVGHLSNYGCKLEDNTFYPDGVQMPSDSKKPCELCYCIRNQTACVRQECTLNVEGCQPIYQDGVCCPVRYDCDYNQIGTTERPSSGGLMLGTTVSPSLQCHFGDTLYNDGELMVTDKPCESCYCMRGDIVCAVRSCGEPMEGKDCEPLPPPEGECCPTTYQCANGTVPTEALELVTQSSIVMHSSDDKQTEDPSSDSKPQIEEGTVENESAPSAPEQQNEEHGEDGKEPLKAVEDKVDVQEPEDQVEHVESDPIDTEEHDDGSELPEANPSSPAELDHSGLVTDTPSDVSEHISTSAPDSVAQDNIALEEVSSGDPAHTPTESDQKESEALPTEAEGKPDIESMINKDNSESSTTKEADNVVADGNESVPKLQDSAHDNSENGQETISDPTDTEITTEIKPDSEKDQEHTDEILIKNQNDNEATVPVNLEGNPTESSNQEISPEEQNDKVNVPKNPEVVKESESSVDEGTHEGHSSDGPENDENGSDSDSVPVASDNKEADLQESSTGPSGIKPDENNADLSVVEATTNESMSEPQVENDDSENSIVFEGTVSKSPESPESLDQIKETEASSEIDINKDSNTDGTENTKHTAIPTPDASQENIHDHIDTEIKPDDSEMPKETENEQEISGISEESTKPLENNNLPKEPNPPRKDDAVPTEPDQQPQHAEGSMTKAEDAITDEATQSPYDETEHPVKQEESNEDISATEIPDEQNIKPSGESNSDITNDQIKNSDLPEEENDAVLPHVAQTDKPESDLPSSTLLPQAVHSESSEKADEVVEDVKDHSETSTEDQSVIAASNDEVEDEVTTDKTKPQDSIQAEVENTNISEEDNKPSEEVFNVVITESEPQTATDSVHDDSNHDETFTVAPESDKEGSTPEQAEDALTSHNLDSSASPSKEPTEEQSELKPSADEQESHDALPEDEVPESFTKPSNSSPLEEEAAEEGSNIVSSDDKPLEGESSTKENEVISEDIVPTKTQSEANELSHNAEDKPTNNIIEDDVQHNSGLNYNKEADSLENNNVNEDNIATTEVTGVPSHEQPDGSPGQPTEGSTTDVSDNENNKESVSESKPVESGNEEEKISSENKPESSSDHLPSQELENTPNEENIGTNDFPEVPHDSVESDPTDIEDEELGVHDDVEHESPSENEIEDQHLSQGGSLENKPDVAMPGPVGVIPGEGDCLVDGQTYTNNSRIPSKSPCHKECTCLSSIVHCQGIDCPPPPAELANCMPVHQGDLCCPVYTCDGESPASPESHNQMGATEEATEDHTSTPLDTLHQSEEVSTASSSSPAEESEPTGEILKPSQIEGETEEDNQQSITYEDENQSPSTSADPVKTSSTDENVPSNPEVDTPVESPQENGETIQIGGVDASQPEVSNDQLEDQYVDNKHSDVPTQEETTGENYTVHPEVKPQQPLEEVLDSEPAPNETDAAEKDTENIKPESNVEITLDSNHSDKEGEQQPIIISDGVETHEPEPEGTVPPTDLPTVQDETSSQSEESNVLEPESSSSTNAVDIPEKEKNQEVQTTADEEKQNSEVTNDTIPEHTNVEHDSQDLETESPTAENVDVSNSQESLTSDYVTPEIDAAEEVTGVAPSINHDDHGLIDEVSQTNVEHENPASAPLDSDVKPTETPTSDKEEAGPVDEVSESTSSLGDKVEQEVELDQTHNSEVAHSNENITEHPTELADSFSTNKPQEVEISPQINVDEVSGEPTLENEEPSPSVPSLPPSSDSTDDEKMENVVTEISSSPELSLSTDEESTDNEISHEVSADGVDKEIEQVTEVTEVVNENKITESDTTEPSEILGNGEQTPQNIDNEGEGHETDSADIEKDHPPQLSDVQEENESNVPLTSNTEEQGTGEIHSEVVHDGSEEDPANPTLEVSHDDSSENEQNTEIHGEESKVPDSTEESVPTEGHSENAGSPESDDLTSEEQEPQSAIEENSSESTSSSSENSSKNDEVSQPIPDFEENSPEQNPTSQDAVQPVPESENVDEVSNESNVETDSASPADLPAEVEHDKTEEHIHESESPNNGLASPTDLPAEVEHDETEEHIHESESPNNGLASPTDLPAEVEHDETEEHIHESESPNNELASPTDLPAVLEHNETEEHIHESDSHNNGLASPTDLPSEVEHDETEEHIHESESPNNELASPTDLPAVLEHNETEEHIHESDSHNNGLASPTDLPAEVEHDETEEHIHESESPSNGLASPTDLPAEVEHDETEEHIHESESPNNGLASPTDLSAEVEHDETEEHIHESESPNNGLASPTDLPAEVEHDETEEHIHESESPNNELASPTDLPAEVEHDETEEHIHESESPNNGLASPTDLPAEVEQNETEEHIHESESPNNGLDHTHEEPIGTKPENTLETTAEGEDVAIVDEISESEISTEESPSHVEDPVQEGVSPHEHEGDGAIESNEQSTEEGLPSHEEGILVPEQGLPSDGGEEANVQETILQEGSSLGEDNESTVVTQQPAYDSEHISHGDETPAQESELPTDHSEQEHEHSNPETEQPAESPEQTEQEPQQPNQDITIDGHSHHSEEEPEHPQETDDKPVHEDVLPADHSEPELHQQEIDQTIPSDVQSEHSTQEADHKVNLPESDKEPEHEAESEKTEQKPEQSSEEIEQTMHDIDHHTDHSHTHSQSEDTDSKPDHSKPVDSDIPTEDQFPSGGDLDYDVGEDGAFGPGTCRYGGKVYVSAQQIPRDDPCDFCFCFRSDIICLQQSCPPPIHRCHQEPIQGYCCPRYQCPVSMATSLNVTTTTTTTTTTLPPHFFAHAYLGAARQAGCLHKGRAYSVGEEITTASGPCLQCICGSDGQMKCDPVVCSPEPMLRKMMEAAVSHRRR